MIAKMENEKIYVGFDIGEYNPDIIDFLTLLDNTYRSKASDEDIEKLSKEINKNWWQQNKKRLLNESDH